MKLYKLRKWTSAFLAVMMLSGCSGGKSEPIEENLYERGIAILQKMDSMAESESYSQIMTTSPQVLAILKEIGRGNYEEPKAVYGINISLKDMDSLKELYGDALASFEELPEELQEDMQHRLVKSIPTIISSNSGASALAAVSLVTGEDYFIDNYLSEDVLYFYVYDGKYGGAVTFSPHEQGIVSASGMFVVLGDWNQDWDKEEFEEALGMFEELLNAEITEIPKPE